MDDFSLRWLASVSGVLSVVAATLLAVAVMNDSLSFLAIPAVGIFVAVIGRLAVHSNARDQARVERLAALDARVGAVPGRISDAVDAVDARTAATVIDLRDALTTLRTADAETTRTVDDLERRTQGEIRKLSDGLVREASQRSLTFARATDPHLPLRRVLLQMTVHRSGSTRLFDRFRLHPSVRVANTMEVFDALELTGRRYPVAFSDTDDAALPIEVSKGVGASIPAAHLPGMRSIPVEDQWLIEKIHPQFTDFDAERLAGRIADLRADGVEVLVVYGIRRPIDAMWSMHEFKTRQPTWYGHLETTDIPDWIARSFESLSELRTLVPGPVFDFDDRDDSPAVRQTLDRLDPTWGETEIVRWIDAAAANFERGTRSQASGSGFLGERADRHDNGPDGAWSGLADVVARATGVYESLRTLRS